jgi:hypothetical protein
MDTLYLDSMTQPAESMDKNIRHIPKVLASVGVKVSVCEQKAFPPPTHI